MGRRSPLFALALIVPLLALAAGGAIVVGFSVEGGATAAMTVLLPAAAALGAFALRRRLGPASIIVASFAALGYAVPLFFASLSTLEEPIATSTFKCGTGAISLAFLLALSSVVGSVGTGALGAVVAKAAKRRAGEISLRVIAATAIAALLALTAVLATHGARESSSTFLASLDATEIPNATTPMATLESWDGDERIVAGTHFSVEHRAGEGVTTTDFTPPRGAARSCVLVVKRGTLEERHAIAYAYDDEEPCPDVRVRHVPSFRDHDAFVVERKFRTPRPSYSPSMVIDGATLTKTELGARDVPELGPPHGWLYGVLAAGALALLFFVASARASSAAPEGLEGAHDGRGWVRFPDGAPRFLPALVGTMSGPVLLRSHASTSAMSYRDDAGAAHDAEVLVGSHAELRSERMQRRAAFACLAIAAALLALAPLLAAAIFGVL